ncbi:MAG TPA: hypothetical protein VFT51_06275 [Bacillales bacterium]|nr:hypothetical protein [Bacillales bacterium]
MKKRYIFMAFALFIAVLNWSAAGVSADEKDRFEISIQSGLNGKVQAEKGFSVTITITNNGDDFTGDLVVTIPQDYDSVANLVIPVELAGGATKDLSFPVSSLDRGFFRNHSPGADMQQIRLFEGDWKDGNTVEINPNLKISPSFFPPTDLVIGVLNRDPDALNYFKLIDSSVVIALDGKDLPESAVGFEVLDTLVINDFAVAKLPNEVQAAIKEWVRRGGQLVIGGTAGMTQKLGALTEILPYAVDGQTSIHELPEISKAGGTPLKLTKFPLMIGQVKDGADIAYNNGKWPVVVTKNTGTGTISQYNFDLSSPVFSEWKGIEHFWKNELDQQVSSGPIMVSSNFVNQQLRRLSSYFASVTKLPFTGLLTLLLLYIVILVPIIYFLLKRFDKREWSWIAVPVIALLFSIGLFVYGAKDRLGPIKTNAVSIMSLDERGVGSGQGTVSLLSQGSGDYTIGIKNNTRVFPIRNNGPFGGSLSSIPTIHAKAETTEVQFRNVEFWTPRSLSVQLPVKKYGGFETDLTYQGSKLTGEITNRSTYDYQKITLFSGSNDYSIGSLKAGESKSISLNVGKGTLFQAPLPGMIMSKYRQAWSSNLTAQDRKERKRSHMIEAAVRSGQFDFDSAILLGFTDTPIYDVKVNGGKTDQSSFSLVMQPISVQIGQGEQVRFDTEIRSPKLVAINGHIRFNPIFDGAESFGASKGTYELRYPLPDSLKNHDFTLESVTVQLQTQDSIAFQIYNTESGKFEKLKGHEVFEFNKQPNQYVDSGEIKIRVIVSQKQGSRPDESIQIPEVRIKGVTKND